MSSERTDAWRDTLTWQVPAGSHTCAAAARAGAQAAGPEPALTNQQLRAQALSGLLEAANTAHTVAEIGDAALACLAQVLHVERASLSLLDDKGVMRFISWRGISVAYHARDDALPWPVSGARPRATLVEAVRTSPPSSQPHNAGEGVAAVASIPLISQGVLLGKLALYYYQPDPFLPAELALAQDVANQIALVVARLRAEETARRACERLEEEVLLRTAELRVANAKLAEELAVRQQMDEALRAYSQQLESLVAERAAKIQSLERQRHEMEQLASAGRMAARIAHEINNPLAGVQNGLLLLKDGIAPDYPYYDYIALVEGEVQRIARIVRQVYGLYQPDREPQHAFSVRGFLTSVAASFGLCAGPGSGAIRIACAPADFMIHQQEALLRQVLDNLIQNALDASPVGADVTVGAVAQGDNCQITVSDCGAGIPEADRLHVFEPFFTTKEAQGGERLGLGLSICHNMTLAMGGTLTFTSSPGQGTDFYLTLPLNCEAAAAPEG